MEHQQLGQVFCCWSIKSGSSFCSSNFFLEMEFFERVAKKGVFCLRFCRVVAKNKWLKLERGAFGLEGFCPRVVKKLFGYVFAGGY